MEREKAAREYEELKRSIEDKKKGIMGMPTVSEALNPNTHHNAWMVLPEALDPQPHHNDGAA